MEYKLEYLVDRDLRIFSLRGDEIWIGKLLENNLVLSDDTISRRHCRLVRSRNTYKVIDNKSTNGTFVNGKKISEKELVEGDTISIGQTHLKFVPHKREATFQDIDDQKISMVVPLSDLSLKVEQPVLKTEEPNFLAAMVELGRTLIASQNMEESFEKLADVIYEFVKPEKIAIFYYNDKQDDLNLRYFSSHDRRKKSQIKISKTIALNAIHEKVAILSSNTRDDERFDRSKSIIIYGITSVISVPIWTKDAIFGLIYIDTTSFARLFLEKDLQMMSIIANFAGFALEAFNNTEKLNREKKLRARFERYHSPSVVSRLMEFQDDKTGEMMPYRENEASILFVDIVGFTPLAEKMKPIEVGLFLNNFFTEMTEVIFHNQGTLDKFIGDAIMAVFGVPFEYKNHAEQALNSALEMMDKLQEINRNIPKERKIQIRIGINCGKVISGDFGSPKRVDYTVLGNAVNIASRLESEVAAADEIVVTEEVHSKTKGKFEFESLGKKKLTGITDPVHIYKVTGRRKEK